MSTPRRKKEGTARRVGPTTPARRPLWRRLVAAYEAAQVETRGNYSVERMLALDTFARERSLTSCAFVLLATPLPCVAIAVLVDAVPLNPSRLGLAHSHWFWLRVALVTFCITFTILEQLRAFVPRLDTTSTRVLVVMSSVIAVGCTAYALLMASLVGYPIPFTLFVGAPSWQVLFWAAVTLRWGRQLRVDRALRCEVVAFFKVVIVQLSLTVVYPAYNHVFAQLDGWPQTAFALGLAVLKLLAKNAFHAVFQHAEDFLPEVIIFNVEIFHALFVAACMQSSKSFTTTAVVIAADLVQIALHMHDVDVVLRKLQRLESKASRRGDTPPHESSAAQSKHPPLPSPLEPPEPLTAALLYVWTDRSLHSDPLIRLQTLPRLLPARPTNAVVPLQPQQLTKTTQPTVSESTGVLAKLERFSNAFGARELDQLERTSSRAERRAYVTTVLRLLHFIEFLVLIEFVEVAVPLVYCLYLVAIAQMPNRAFYPQLAAAAAQGSSLSATVGSIVAYTALELATFLGLCLLLRYKLRLSPVKQLAFVLRRQWIPVQSKMVLWVVVVVGSSLEQFGYDYSFQFAWLRSQPAGT